MSEEIENKDKNRGKNIYKYVAAALLGFDLLCGGAVGGAIAVRYYERFSDKSPSQLMPTPIGMIMPTPYPTETTLMIMPTPYPTETTLAAPVETVEEVESSSDIIIKGAPEIVSRFDLRKWANEPQPAPGDVRHINTIGWGTEAWLAEPGVRTALDVKDCGDDPSCWVLTPNRQEVLTDPAVIWPLNEEGFAMFTGATMKLKVGDMEIQVPRLESNGWIVIVRGLPRDYQKGTDNNLPIVVSDYDPGFTSATMLPPGQYVSEDYFLQNAAAVQGVYNGRRDPSGCGADGCTTVSALFFDARTGAFTIIRRVSPNGYWRPLGTNIDE